MQNWDYLVHVVGDLSQTLRQFKIIKFAPGRIEVDSKVLDTTNTTLTNSISAYRSSKYLCAIIANSVKVLSSI